MISTETPKAVVIGAAGDLEIGAGGITAISTKTLRPSPLAQSFS